MFNNSGLTNQGYSLLFINLIKKKASETSLFVRLPPSSSCRSSSAGLSGFPMSPNPTKGRVSGEDGRQSN